MRRRKRLTPARFELAPFRNGTLNRRLRPLGQSVKCLNEFSSGSKEVHLFVSMRSCHSAVSNTVYSRFHNAA